MIVGGGFVGLEVAENLRDRGLAVTIVELAPQVLAPIDAEMVTYVHDELLAHGIELRLGRSVAELTASSAILDDGESIDADLVIFAIGVRPETTLARAAGLEIGTRGGIVVDESLRTSDPHIWAVGDATEKPDSVLGGATLVPLANLANRQGRRAADAIVGAGATVRVDPQRGGRPGVRAHRGGDRCQRAPIDGGGPRRTRPPHPRQQPRRLLPWSRDDAPQAASSTRPTAGSSAPRASVATGSTSGST